MLVYLLDNLIRTIYKATDVIVTLQAKLRKKMNEMRIFALFNP